MLAFLGGSGEATHKAPVQDVWKRKAAQWRCWRSWEDPERLHTRPQSKMYGNARQRNGDVGVLGRIRRGYTQGPSPRCMETQGSAMAMLAFLGGSGEATHKAPVQDVWKRK